MQVIRISILNTPSVPRKQVILGLKICPRKQVILLYIESAFACKNQLLPNMGYNKKEGNMVILPSC